MKVTACECVEPGWCQRHRCFKNELDFQLCRRRPDYFQLWEQGRGPGQGESGSRGRRRSARSPTPPKPPTAGLPQARSRRLSTTVFPAATGEP